MTVVIEKHIHKDFIESAVAQGWTVGEGPWGYSEAHERTVSLTKHVPAIGGSVLIWLIHRSMGTMVWSNEASRWVTSYPENQWMVGVEAWHRAETGGEQNLRPVLAELLVEGLSEDYWKKLAFTCDECGKVVERVHHVAFANKACDVCVAGMRAVAERPGWNN